MVLAFVGVLGFVFWGVFLLFFGGSFGFFGFCFVFVAVFADTGCSLCSQ